MKVKNKSMNEMILLARCFELTVIVSLMVTASQESPLKDEQSSCFPDHCKNREASELSDPTTLTYDDFLKSPCFCDDECSVYDDCCKDKQTSAKSFVNQKLWICDSVPSINQHFYMTGSCPSAWPDNKIAKLCRRDVIDDEYSYILDVPLLSQFNKQLYANLYCAQCHGDVNLVNVTLEIVGKFDLNPADNITTFLKDAKYLAGQRKWLKHVDRKIEINLSIPYYKNITLFNSEGVRRCKPVIRECLDSFRETGEEKKCKSNINNFISEKNEKKVYKNFHCARCNNVSDADLNRNCENEKTRPRHDGLPAYSILFDFNSGSGPVGYKTCSKGEILDPLDGSCISFGCGELYEKIDGKCELKIRTNANISDNSTVISSQCPILFVNSKDIISLSNGTIYVNTTKKTYQLGQYEMYNKSLVRVCAQQSYQDKFSVIQSRLSTVTMTISFCCLACHIFIHFLLPKLRNLPGKNLLSLSISLFIGQIVFFFGINKVQIPELCITIGIIIHYCFLAVFFWMSIMAVDIYSTFTKLHAKMTESTKSKRYIKYSIVAWLVPLMIVSMAIMVDNTDIFPEIRPAYGQQRCWISRREGLLAFFVVPAGILIVLNTVVFVLTAHGIHQTSHVVQCAKSVSESTRFYLYVKLAFIMGLTWIFGFIAALAEIQALWYVFIVLNASQGAFIFVVFTLKRKVLQQLFEKLTGKSLPVFGETNNVSTSVKSSSRRTSSSRMLHSQKSNPST